MARQHSSPILLSTGRGASTALNLLNQTGSSGSVLETDIQALVESHPECLPVAEIDPLFAGAVHICRELVTPAGSIDNLLITPTGLPVIVECKLWRNPEGRRSVVGQILDYAKELTRWSSSDLQREVNRRLKTDGSTILNLVRDVDPSVDEIQFNDSLTLNLRRGRFLLLIVGDGIREGVEAIAEYIQGHAGLHFSLGLVELPIYLMPSGDRLVVPRILARTSIITRTVIALPNGFSIQAEQADLNGEEVSPERQALADTQQQFWAEFLAYLNLDDPDQQRPKPARQGYITLMLPSPNGSCWLTVYRELSRNEVGVFLSSTRNTIGETAANAIAEEWNTLKDELGPDSRLTVDRYGRPRVAATMTVASLDNESDRRDAFVWLADKVNAFVNALRPRVRSIVADHSSHT